MTISTTIFASMLSPQVRVVEDVGAQRANALVGHSLSILFATGSNDFGKATVSSVTDFTNLVGSSPSLPAVRAYFRNSSPTLLYVHQVVAANRFVVNVPSPGAGTYVLTVNGAGLSHVAVAGATEASILAALRDLVFSQFTDVTATINGTDLVVRSVEALTVSGSANLEVTDDTGTEPDYLDLIGTVEAVSSLDLVNVGFLLAPEFLSTALTSGERLAVIDAMVSKAEAKDIIAVIDRAPDTISLASIIADRQTFGSPKGHAVYLGQYATDLEGVSVPMSAYWTGLANRAYNTQGINKAVAGKSLRLNGLTAVTPVVSEELQGQLEPQGVVVARLFTNEGYFVWSNRTVSTDPLYFQTQVRVVMNVLNNTLRKSFDRFLFEPILGNGVLLLNVARACRQVCEQLYLGGALFGQSSNEAYTVICDFTNNPDDALERGEVFAEVYARVTPNSEKVLIATYRVALTSL